MVLRQMAAEAFAAHLAIAAGAVFLRQKILISPLLFAGSRPGWRPCPRSPIPYGCRGHADAELADGN